MVYRGNMKVLVRELIIILNILQKYEAYTEKSEGRNGRISNSFNEIKFLRIKNKMKTMCNISNSHKLTEKHLLN